MSKGSSTTSQSGYSNLPSDLQGTASYLGQGLLNSYWGNQAGQTASQNQLNSIGSGSYSDPYTQYYGDVVSGKYTDLANNSEFQNAMGALTQQYGEGLTNTLNTANSSAQKAGNFLSSYSGDYNTKLTDTALTDYLNQIANTTLSAYTTERGYQNSAGTDLASYLASLGNTSATAVSAGNTTTQDLIGLLTGLAGSTSYQPDNTLSTLLGIGTTLGSAVLA